MNRPDLVCVITTIQEPTACVCRLGATLARVPARVIVMGDKKGPAKFDLPQADFFSLERQGRLPFRLAPLLPVGHYVRKNLGYLEAIRRHPACIYETDDDNMPNDAWAPRKLHTRAQAVAVRGQNFRGGNFRGWCNVYRIYSDALIWPRGFPLDLVRDPATFAHDRGAPEMEVEAPIQQGLANLSPDVDAVWRLILDQDFNFAPGPSLHLPAGVWCPFNSQTTWWWPAAYPLLYLPSFCTFRMTDIWRSFVAQRCLWELGRGLVFHAAEVIQERNVHNLLRDFKDEVPGYLQNHQIVQKLADLSLRPRPEAVGDNLLRCYEALVAAAFIPQDELPLVRAWLDDLSALA